MSIKKEIAPLDQDDPDAPNRIVSINDEKNPRSVLNLMPPKMQDYIRKSLIEYPHYYEMDEFTLRTAAAPDDTTDALRISFWQEYFRAQSMFNKRMSIVRILSGVVTDAHFYTAIAPNSRKMAWILCPPSNYMLAMEAYLNKGMRNLSRIMGMDVLDKDGHIITKNAQIFLKAFEMLMDRTRGAVIQKLETKQAIIQKNINVDQKELRLELEALEEKQRAGLIVDVETTQES